MSSEGPKVFSKMHSACNQGAQPGSQRKEDHGPGAEPAEGHKGASCCTFSGIGQARQHAFGDNVLGTASHGERMLMFGLASG